MSYILVFLMNLLELIALTLTSVMVFYHLRVCVCVVATVCNRNVLFAFRQDILAQGLFCCNSGDAFNKKIMFVGAKMLLKNA